MIQTVLALSQFFINNFPDISWYPDWYLGVPFHYLIGPVIPALLGIFNFQLPIFNEFSMLQKYLILVTISWVVGGMGVYKLVRGLMYVARGPTASPLVTSLPFIVSLLFLLLPFYFFLLLSGSNGLYHFAWGFLPWVFVVFLQFLQKKDTKFALLLCVLIAFLSLIDISILLPLVVGFICLGVVRGIGEYQIFKTFIIILLALSLATVWYTPGFWLTLLQNPSFGGMPLVNLGKFLFQLLLNLVPILAAVWVVKLRHKKPQPLLFFGILFTFSFLLLTLFRFLSDPDFVRDWIGFFIEIQFGVAILLGQWMSSRTPIRDPSFVSNELKFPLRGWIPAFAGMTILLALILRGWVGGMNGEYKKRVTEMLQNVPKSERVFLSGTSVFWINSKLDIAQVRGGVDQASIHPFWAHGVFQIREGESSELALNWLKALGASWILVHGEGSQEPYRDFKHLEKFGGIGEIGGIREIREEKGDTLYKVSGASIARVADKSILEVKKPKNGADQDTLTKYVNTFKTPLSLTSSHFARLVEINADLKKDEVISLAISFSPGWAIEGGAGGRVVGDSLGNIVVIPAAAGRVHLSLEYRIQAWERVIPVLISLVLVFMILNYDKFYPGMSRILAKLSHGLGEEE